jgi:hypothetical protein|tara:strand:- start:6636 stop:6932 length:297 start_codon:yes stop_codon:yes gene_type:complete
MQRNAQLLIDKIEKQKQQIKEQTHQIKEQTQQIKNLKHKTKRRRSSKAQQIVNRIQSQKTNHIGNKSRMSLNSNRRSRIRSRIRSRSKRSGNSISRIS